MNKYILKNSRFAIEDLPANVLNNYFLLHGIKQIECHVMMDGDIHAFASSDPTELWEQYELPIQPNYEALRGFLHDSVKQLDVNDDVVKLSNKNNGIIDTDRVVRTLLILWRDGQL